MIRAIKKGATTHSVYRFGTQQYLTGRAVDDAGTLLPIDMWEQPMSGDDLQRLPEGYRADNVKKFYALSEVRSASIDSSDPYPADEIELDSKRWEVRRVWDWERDGGYWKVFATRKGQ